MDKRKNYLTAEQETEITRLYTTEKKAVREVSEITGFRKFTVTRVLRARGIVCRENKQYAYHDDVFSKIDTEEKAYWLGFLYADGEVVARRGFPPAYVRLGLDQKDFHHVLRFSRFMSDDELRVETRVETQFDPPCTTKRVTVCSRKIASDLVALGCVPRKSEVLTFPGSDVVPVRLVRHFIRGYFDGDGSVYTIRCKGRQPNIEISFNGTQAFLQGVIDFLAKKIPGVTTLGVAREGQKNNFRVHKSAKQGRDICKWMYHNASLYLDRKYQRYLVHRNKPSQAAMPVTTIGEKILEPLATWESEVNVLRN